MYLISTIDLDRMSVPTKNCPYFLLVGFAKNYTASYPIQSVS